MRFKYFYHSSLDFNVKGSNDTFYHSELDICGRALAVSEANEGMDKRITDNTIKLCFHYGEGNEDKVKQCNMEINNLE